MKNFKNLCHTNRKILNTLHLVKSESEDAEQTELVITTLQSGLLT